MPTYPNVYTTIVIPKYNVTLNCDGLVLGLGTITSQLKLLGTKQELGGGFQ